MKCTCPPLPAGDQRIGTALQLHRTCRDEKDPACPWHGTRGTAKPCQDISMARGSKEVK